MNRLLFGVRISLWPWLGILVSLGGLALLTGTSSELHVGDGFTLCCAACFGLQVTLLDHYAPKHDPTVLAFGQLAAVAVVCLTAWCLAGPHPLPLPGPRVATAIVVTGILCSGFAFFVQTLAQKHLTAIEAAIIIMTEPIFAAIVGKVWGGDQLTELQWIGAGWMMVAMTGVSLQPLFERLAQRRRAALTEAARR